MSNSLQAGDTVTLHCKKWFDEINGNTYFSCRIMVNSTVVTVLPFQYGYDDHYIDMATKWLAENGYTNVKRSACGSYPGLRRTLDAEGVALVKAAWHTSKRSCKDNYWLE